MKSAKNGNRLLTPKQAAALAGMSRQAFMKHIGRNITPDRYVGNNADRPRFRRSTVERWIERREADEVRKRGPQPHVGAVCS